jgi:hypothetical protein
MIMALVALLALLLLAVTLQDAFEVMLLPRRVMRRLRFVSLFYRLTWLVWSALAYRLPRDGQREHVLGVYGALSLVLLFDRRITGDRVPLPRARPIRHPAGAGGLDRAALRRANPPGAGARADGSVAEIAEAGVIGVEFFPNRGGSQHALIPCSS